MTGGYSKLNKQRGTRLTLDDVNHIETQYEQSKTDAEAGYWDVKVGTISYSSLSDKPSLGDASSKNVGTTTGTVALGDHTHAGYVAANNAITGASKAKITYDAKGLVTSGANLEAGDIPEHSHTGYVASNTAITPATNPKITYDAKGLVTSGAALGTGDIPDISGTYALTGHGHGLGTAAAKTVGDASTNLQENGAALGASQTVETDANKKFVSAAKASGYNLATGTTAGTVATGDHTHAGYAPSANGVTNGDSHDHLGGDGAQIAHTSLSSIGTNTHAQIDTHMGIANPADVSGFRRNGTTRPRWYTMALTTSAKSVSGALTSGRMYALPFIVPKSMTLDFLAVNCTTLGTAAHLRLGIYNDSGNCEPGALLIDAGVADTSGTGVKTVACAQALSGGSMYWLAALSDNATHAFRAPVIAGIVNVLGDDVAFPTTHITHFYAAQSYGALPGTFPTVTQGTGIIFPLIYARLSAGGT